MNPSSRHLDFLDYFRGVAILGVLFYHATYTPFGPHAFEWVGEFRFFDLSKVPLIAMPAYAGWVGVPIFFTVSGFCIHLSHRRAKEGGFTTFFLRRFFRIYPPYLLALLLCTFVFADTRIGWGVLTHNYDILRSSLRQFFSHVFLVHNFGDDWVMGINPAFWSIAVEVQLYLIYPLLMWLTLRLGWQRALWVTATIELGMRSFTCCWISLYPTAALPSLYTCSPFYFWFTWTMGAALAEAYLKGQPLPFRSALGYVWPVLFVPCFFFNPLSVFCYPLAALTSTHLMAYYLSRPAPSEPARGWKGYVLGHLRWAGIVSYGAYLIHLPLLSWVPHFAYWAFHRESSPLVQYGLYLCSWFPIFGCSYLFYRYVELPSIAVGKWVVKQANQSRGKPPSPQAALAATS